MKILIADNHRIVREGIKHILSEMPDVIAMDEAGNGQEVLQKAWESDYDIILLDISMPGRSGLEILKQLKNGRPSLKILVLSMYPEDHYAVRAIKAGAFGYLTKESDPDELLEAVRKISTGRKYISSSLAETLARHLETGYEKLPHETLSDREFEVMCKIASGKTVKEIAVELSLSAKTISTYRTRILCKTGMKNNAQLTHYTIRNQLVS